MKKNILYIPLVLVIFLSVSCAGFQGTAAILSYDDIDFDRIKDFEIHDLQDPIKKGSMYFGIGGFFSTKVKRQETGLIEYSDLLKRSIKDIPGAVGGADVSYRTLFFGVPFLGSSYSKIETRKVLIDPSLLIEQNDFGYMDFDKNHNQ